MNVEETALEGVLVLRPKVFGDDRGAFLETWSARRYADAGVPREFVQDNLSRSRRGVLRGLHLQHPHGQGKLVSVPLGEVYDVAVDVRVGSPTFGRWIGVRLDDRDRAQLYIPPGFAHGFCVLSETALFTYKCTDYYHPESELGILWNDPDLAIDWPTSMPELSAKDAEYPRLSAIEPAKLPTWK